jgi:hypothetical protein
MVHDIQAIDAKIRLMQATAEELQQLGGQIPFIDRNVARILASLKMLEIGISDAAEMGLI